MQRAVEQAYELTESAKRTITDIGDKEPVLWQRGQRGRGWVLPRMIFPIFLPVFGRKCKNMWYDFTMTTCQGPDCSRPIEVQKRMLCMTHNTQVLRGAPLTPIRQYETPPQGICEVDDCERVARSRNLCLPHASIANRMRIETEDFVRIQRERWCYACQDTVPPGTKLHIDHDHGCCPTTISCGRCVRGTLCAGCNIRLGWCRDKPDDPGLIAYLRDAPHITLQPWVPRYKSRHQQN